MRTLVTMALPYANGSLHLGHFVEAIQTDVYVRALRAMGREVAFICANDMHGTPIEMSAAKAGLPPEEYVERIHREHREDYAAFQISLDEFYTTHSEENRLRTQEIYRKLVERGSIERREVEKLYCEVDGRFLPDRYVRGTCPACGAKDQYGDACEVCGSTYEAVQLKDPYCAICKDAGRGIVRPVLRRSAHYFVKLSQYQDFLRKWTTEPGRVQPDIRGFLARWLAEPLKDWDISRDEPYFGFEIPDRPPGEEKKYFYVWLDAPTGYLSSTEHWARKRGRTVEEWWGADSGTEIVHFIGKDIVYFHTLFWPAMLHASGWRVPARVHVHGMLTVEGTKMSKTRGTFINAREYLDAGLDHEWLRYYFAANLGATASDIDLSLGEMKNRVNGELLNSVGNLANRALSILWKSLSGKLGLLPGDAEGVDLWHQASLQRASAMQAYLRVDSRAAVQAALAVAAAGNERLQRKQPWKTIATDPEGARRELTLAVNLARVCAAMLEPVVPRFAQGIVEQTGAPLPAVTITDLLRATLRHRPDRILVGEVRGAEAFDLLQALNTGHLGSLSTIHANSAEQALTRFAHCVLTANVGLPHAATREAIAFAINLVIHIARDGSRRVVTQVVALRGYDGRADAFTLEALSETGGEQVMSCAGACPS